MSDTAYYMQYVEALDEGNFTVTNWEAGFLASLLEQPPAWLTPNQIGVIQRMAKKYLGEEIT